MDRKLSFKIGSVSVIKREFGKSIFELLSELKGLDEFIGLAYMFIYAGAASVNYGEDVDFTPEDCKKWANELSLSEIVRLMNAVTSSYIIEADDAPQLFASSGLGASRGNDPGGNGAASVGDVELLNEGDDNENPGVHESKK